MTDDTRARPVSDKDLERYEQWADLKAPHLLAGEVNWPMMVRSLVAEIRRLKSGSKAEESKMSGSELLSNWFDVGGHWRQEGGSLEPGTLCVVRKDGSHQTPWGDRLVASTYQITDELWGVEITSPSCAWEFLPDEGECARIGMPIVDHRT